LPSVEGDKQPKKTFKSYPIGYFHIDIAEVLAAQGKLYLPISLWPSTGPPNPPLPN
jgi:hypothetical protein